MNDKLYLGVEVSTQQLKVIAVADNLEIIYETFLKFDSDLPEFKTDGGVHRHADNVTVTAPTLMWVKAMDVVLEKMKADNFPFDRVAALSGTGQQHGSVYWRFGADEILANLNSKLTLYEQLKDSFTISDSPVWMDSSTTKQCEQLEKALGGPQEVSRLTGCRAYHRMTGNQICKLSRDQAMLYNNTQRISLVSSFAASLFLSGYAPIDESDGSGMNLLDLRTRLWSKLCIQAYELNGLEEKLGPVVKSYECVGRISSYMIERYGFKADCKIIAFTGDNPASLVGLQPQPDDIMVSLGTGDTVLIWLKDLPEKPSIDGVILINPLNSQHYMGMLCFKNGSLTREKIKNSVTPNSTDWSQFNNLLNSTQPGNSGCLGIYFDLPEITPNAIGIHRFDADDKSVDSFRGDVEVRALIESQFLSRRVYCESLGYKPGNKGRILATGGASSNNNILQVLADVFNAPVYTQSVQNSACLGSAFRAKHGLMMERGGGEEVGLHELFGSVRDSMSLACKPNPTSAQVYNGMTGRYRTLEQRVVNSQ